MEYPKLPINGSVDNDGEAFNISDDNVRRTQNLIPDKLGNPVRRGAMEFEAALTNNDVAAHPAVTFILHRTDVTTPYATDVNVADTPPIWMAIPDLANGRFIFGTCHNNARFDITISGAGKLGNDSVSFNAKDTVPDLFPSVVLQSGKTYIVYGPNPWRSAGAVFTPSSTDPLGYVFSDLIFNGTENEEVQPDMACDYKGRIVYGFRDGRIIWANRFDALTIGNGALVNRSLDLKMLGLGKLVALHAVMLDGSGSLATSGLVAHFEFGCKLILGEPLETTESGDPFGDLQINNLSLRAGCVSGASIVDTEWGTIWVGPDDVWMMPYGSVPVPIGRHLKPILTAQPAAMRFRIHAVMAGGFLRIALFSPGQVGAINETLLGEQWWLDLRDGPPSDWTKARWFGPQIFKQAYTANAGARSTDGTVQGTRFMLTDPREGKNVIFGCEQAQIQDTAGAIISRPVLVTYDNPSNRDVSGFFRESLDTWTPSTAINLGNEITVMVDGAKRPLVLVCTTAGVTGLTQPVWAVAATIADNTVVWTLVGTALGPYDTFGSEILGRWDSKEYDFGTRMMPKLLNGIEANIYNSAPVLMRFSQIIDGGKTSSILDKELDASSGPILGADLIKDAPPLAKEYKSVSARPGEDTRKNGNSVQYRIQEETGIVIPAAFRTFGIVDVGNRAPDRLTLPLGYYTDLLDLTTAIFNLWVTPGSAFYTKYGENWTFEVDGRGKVKITNADFRWAPPRVAAPSTRADRFVWSLLGFDLSNYTPDLVQEGNALPFDVLLGLGLGFQEVTASYHAFGRRPQ